jgi:hypothetical protein
VIAVGSRSDEYDAAAIVHHPERLLGQQGGALEIDVHETVEVLLGQVFDGNGFAEAGIVDQEVDVLRAERFARCTLHLFEECVEG